MASGIENLPANIKNSEILETEALTKLASVSPPSEEEVESFAKEPEISAILEYFADDPDEQVVELHKLAKEFILQDKVVEAWKTLLQG
jgi:hypothetical protein